MIRLSVAPLPHPWLLRCTPSAYEEAVKVQMGGIPGIKWQPAANDVAGCYVGAAEALAPVIATLRAAKVVSGGEMPIGLTRRMHVTDDKLRAYQREGAAWCAWMLRETSGALLADEMGIGKTAQAISAIAALGVDSATVVCPAIVAPHWRGQILKWMPDEGAREEGCGWAVYSYEAFTRAWAKGTVTRSDVLVVDECHYISNPKAKRSQAIAGFRAMHSPAVLLLSGTPMTTRPADLWHPLDLMHPGRWGTKFAFEKRYCAGHFEEIPGLDKAKWEAKGSSNVDELAARLRAVMLRRTKAEVLAELPQRTRVVIEVELPAKARKALKAATMALDWAGNGKAGVGSLLSQVEGYKIDAALSLARDVLANGGRPLILCNRKATAESIADELQCPCAHGDNSSPDDRRGKLLAGEGAAVSTIDSVTTGIDLVQFDCVIFTGLDWVPSKLLQAESRIHRLGQQRGVTIYFLVGVGSIDEVVRERVIDRLGVIATLAGGDEALMASELGGNDDDVLADLLKAIKGE
jgi:SWI/SNF-related matrix-associated actin-dependent regulator 1 of chromatin subfamily A